MIPRAYKGAALLLTIVVLCSLSYCRGKSEARLNVQEEVIDRKLDSLVTENRVLAGDTAKKSKQIAALSDSIKKKKVQYIHTRDSIPIIPAIEPVPPQFALVDTVAMYKAFAEADSALALAERKDSAQEARWKAGQNLISIRDEAIRLLNQRNELAAKRIGSARRQGFLVGFASAAFVVVTAKALQ